MELNTGCNIRYEEVPSHSATTSTSTSVVNSSNEASDNATHKRNADRLLTKEDNDGWYKLARQFVLDRFNASHYSSVNSNITGVEVCRISRCVNKGLRLRFDARVNELHIDLHNEIKRKYMLFWMSIVYTSTLMQSTFQEHVIYNDITPLQT